MPVWVIPCLLYCYDSRDDRYVFAADETKNSKTMLLGSKWPFYGVYGINYHNALEDINISSANDVFF